MPSMSQTVQFHGRHSRPFAGTLYRHDLEVRRFAPGLPRTTGQAVFFAAPSPALPWRGPIRHRLPGSEKTAGSATVPLDFVMKVCLRFSRRGGDGWRIARTAHFGFSLCSILSARMASVTLNDFKSRSRAVHRNFGLRLCLCDRVLNAPRNCLCRHRASTACRDRASTVWASARITPRLSARSFLHNSRSCAVCFGALKKKRPFITRHGHVALCARHARKRFCFIHDRRSRIVTDQNSSPFGWFGIVRLESCPDSAWRGCRADNIDHQPRDDCRARIARARDPVCS